MIIFQNDCMLLKIKKSIEYHIAILLAYLSPSLAKQFVFRKDQHLTFNNIYIKENEVELLLLPFFVKNDSHFIDIGANRGLYCFYAEKVFGSNNIIAFEPIPSLCKLLSKLFPLIQIEQIAVSDITGTSILKIPLQNSYKVDTRSTLEQSSNDLSKGFEEISVKTITLDDYIEKRNPSKVSLVKIDVEGHEMKVILGAKNLLERDRPFLIVEIEQRHHQNDFVRVFDLIEESEYIIYYFNRSSLSLEQPFDVNHNFTLPDLNSVHNYVCIPKETSNIVSIINFNIKQ